MKKGGREISFGPGVRALNPGAFPHGATVPILPAPLPKKKGTGMGKPRGRAPMNKTETAYSHILEAMKRRGDIAQWEREGITLRWPDGMTYTPDFTVITKQFKADPDFDLMVAAHTFIEVKGPKIEEDALVKFRAARARWPLYGFQMHQLKAGTWTRLL